VYCPARIARRSLVVRPSAPLFCRGGAV